MNPVLESLFKHRSIRKYKNKPLEDEKLQLIIKAAQAAPSWCNGEQVSIIAVRDQALREKIKGFIPTQNHICTCSVFLIFCKEIPTSCEPMIRVSILLIYLSKSSFFFPAFSKAILTR